MPQNTYGLQPYTPIQTDYGIQPIVEDSFSINPSQFSSFNTPAQSDNSFRLNPSQFKSLDDQYGMPEPVNPPKPPEQMGWADFIKSTSLPTPMGNFSINDVYNKTTKPFIDEFGSQMGHSAMGLAEMWAKGPIGAGQEMAQSLGKSGLEMIPGFSDPAKTGTFGSGDPSMQIKDRLAMLALEQLGGYNPEGIMGNLTHGNYSKAAAGVIAPTLFNVALGKALHVAPGTPEPHYTPGGQGIIPGMEHVDFGQRAPDMGPAGDLRITRNEPLPSSSALSPEFFQAMRQGERSGSPFPQPELRYPGAETQAPLFEQMPENQGGLNFDQYRRNGRNVRLSDLQNQGPNAFGGELGPTVGEMPVFDRTPTMEDFAPRENVPSNMWPDPSVAPPVTPPVEPPTTGGMWPDLNARPITEPTAPSVAPESAPSVNPIMDQMRNAATPAETPVTTPVSTEVPTIEGVRFENPDTAVVTHATSANMEQLKRLGFVSTKEIVPTKNGVQGGGKFVRKTNLAETQFVQARTGGATTTKAPAIVKMVKGELHIPAEHAADRTLNEKLDKQGFMPDRVEGNTVIYKRKPLPNDAGVIDFTSQKERLRQAQEALDETIMPGEKAGQTAPFISPDMVGFDHYQLPDGSVVPTDATATKGQPTIDYQLKGGEMVTAKLIKRAELDAYGEPVNPNAKPPQNVKDYLREQGIDSDAPEFQNPRNRETPTEHALDRHEIDTATTKKQASDLVKFWTERGAEWARNGEIASARHAAEMRDLAMNKAFSMPETPSPDSLTNPTAKSWADQLLKLDGRAAQDSAYRKIMGDAGNNNPLKKGETWRNRILQGIEYFEGKRNRLLKAVDRVMKSDDTGATPIISDLLNRMEDMDEAVPRRKEKSKLQKWYDLSRGNTTTGDMSAALKQGSPLWYTKQWRTAFGKMTEAFGSESAAQTIMNEIRSRDLFAEGWNTRTNEATKSFAEQSGLHLPELDDPLTAREESIGGDWTETGEMFGKDNAVQRAYQKTAGRYARASNRAYNAFLASLRADTFQIFIDNTRRLYEVDQAAGGRNGAKDPFNDSVYARQMADAVNTLTGRGPLKLDIPTSFTGKTGVEISAEGISRPLSNLLFSPRLLASRIRMLNPGTYIMAPPYVRAQYLKGALAVATLWSAGLGLAKLAGAEVETDPRSADWMKAKFGNTRIDAGQGFQQQLVLLARLASGYTKSSASGKEFELGAGYKADTEWDLIERWGSNKLHPTLKFGYDWFKRSERQPFHMGDKVAQMFIPMIAGDLMDLAREDPKLLPLIIPIGLGMGSQTYDKGQTESKYIGQGGAFGPGGMFGQYGIPDKSFVGGGWGQSPVKRKGL